MQGSAPNVLRRNGLLSKKRYRELVSETVRKIQLENSFTDEELADLIGASEGTVANARNQNNSLSGELLFNLLDVDALALDGHLAHFSRRSVPQHAQCDTDVIVPTSAAVHKLAVANADQKIDDDECLDCEPEIDAAIEALCGLKSRCHAIRKARAA